MTKFSRSGERILLVEFFARGGLLHYSWQLSAGLARARPSSEVFLLTGRRPELGGHPDGVELLPWLWTWNPHQRPPRALRRVVRAWHGLRYAAAWMQILAAARRLRPDVIVFGDLEHRCDAWGIAGLGRGGPRRAAVWHNVDAFERTRPGPLVRRAPWRDRLVGEFDAVFVHGRALARQLWERTGVRATVIAHGNQNGLAAAAAAAAAAISGETRRGGRPLVLLFGSLTQYKGIPVLLEALAQLGPEVRPQAVIAGLPTADVDIGALQRLASRLGLEKEVRWETGYIPASDLGRFFGPADVVVLPYLAASQSGVAHLAMTYGKPLIVSDAGSLGELIDGNGRVVPAGDAAALARALVELTEDAGLRRRMGERSTQLSQRDHDWGKIGAQVWSALDAVGGPRVAAMAE